MAAVGTCVITQSLDRPVKSVIFDWTSDSSSGAVSGGAALTPFVVSGQIIRITTVPSASAAPTNLYDMVLNDADAVDVAQAFIQNRSTSNTESVAPIMSSIPAGGTLAVGRSIFVDSTLELVISNCGTSKAGKVRVYYL